MASIIKIPNRSMSQVRTKVNFIQAKITGPPVIVNILSSDTTSKLADFNSRLAAADENVFLLENAFRSNNDLMVPAIKELQEFTADYFEVFIRGNRRGVFPNSDRALIGLNSTNNQIPPQGNYSEIIATGLLAINGDARRITAGSAPMAMPAIADVLAKYTPANLYYLNNSNHSELLSAARQVVGGLLAEGILLCNKMDNEIETYFNNGNHETMRHNAGFWGVRYTSSTPIGYLDLTVLNAATKAALQNVALLATPGLEEGITDIQGYKRMNIHTFGLITVDFTLPGFLPGSAIFESVDDETIVRTLFLTPIPPPPSVE